MATNNLDLLSGLNLVSCPFIIVKIGEYTFGAYDKTTRNERDSSTGTSYTINGITYPNFIQSLDIVKINGQVNTYTLSLTYAITEKDDPNFFEKIFSSISRTRKITFSYGDMNLPKYVYKNEEAIITDVKKSFSITNSSISYTISAVSSAKLLSISTYQFNEQINRKPSDVIFDLLYDNRFGLTDIFTGMRNRTLVESSGIILRDDMCRNIEAKRCTPLEYLSYLVNYMTAVPQDVVLKNQLYILSIVDDTTGQFNGPYFKITRVDKMIQQSDAYEIDIGYPSKNVIIDYQEENNETYSIYYDYQNQLNGEEYSQRINELGQIEEKFVPIISSGNNEFETNETDKSWWSKVTQFPIKCSIKLRGLLRPAILMTHVRLNIYFYGRKYISSGLYVVTKQQDTIGVNGWTTTLNLLRISGD